MRDALKLCALPVPRVVYCRGDAVRVVGRETEAVVLLEALIGPDTERGRDKHTIQTF